MNLSVLNLIMLYSGINLTYNLAIGSTFNYLNVVKKKVDDIYFPLPEIISV